MSTAPAPGNGPRISHRAAQWGASADPYDDRGRPRAPDPQAAGRDVLPLAARAAPAPRPGAVRGDHGGPTCTVSRRGRVDDLVKALGANTGISESEVSRICADLDEEVRLRRRRQRGRSGRCWSVRVDEGRTSGWRVEIADGSVCLDAWLVQQATPMADGIPLPGYGSNASPSTVVANGTPLPSVRLACTMEDQGGSSSRTARTCSVPRALSHGARGPARPAG